MYTFWAHGRQMSGGVRTRFSAFMQKCALELQKTRFWGTKKRLDRSPNRARPAEPSFHYLYVQPQSIEISTICAFFILDGLPSTPARPLNRVPQNATFAAAGHIFA